MVGETFGELTLPALRGKIGNWVYYSCLMTISEIGHRVDYAQDIHTDEQLSRLIQRQLEGKRAVAIAQYLANTDERFFNSLVLATYEGRPEWLEIRHVEPHTDRAEAASLPEDVLETLGFLSLAGSERIFAVDGQHRLAGIKRAIKDGFAFAGERLPVIFVAHVEKERERTRRLFTTLNKSAKAVKKSDIIALDEDDTMAITATTVVVAYAKHHRVEITVKKEKCGQRCGQERPRHPIAIPAVWVLLGFARPHYLSRHALEDAQCFATIARAQLALGRKVPGPLQ